MLQGAWGFLQDSLATVSDWGNDIGGWPKPLHVPHGPDLNLVLHIEEGLKRPTTRTAYI